MNEQERIREILQTLKFAPDHAKKVEEAAVRVRVAQKRYNVECLILQKMLKESHLDTLDEIDQILVECDGWGDRHVIEELSAEETNDPLDDLLNMALRIKDEFSAETDAALNEGNAEKFAMAGMRTHYARQVIATLQARDKALLWADVGEEWNFQARKLKQAE